MASAPSKGQRKPALAPDSFLEALRDLKTGVASEAKVQITKAVTEDLPQAFGFGKSGTLNPNQTVSLEQIQQAELRGERRAESRFTNRLEQERMVFLRSENETKAQIKNVLAEIQSLAKSAGDLGKEVQIAAMQAPANPGVYHRNFFEQLKSYIANLRRKVQESKHWLATTNARASKRNYYWGQVGKSGTKFMLSQERYMVTSTG